MAQGQLTAAAGCAAVLAAGAVAELAGPGSTALLTGADYAVGAGFALGGAWLLATDRGCGRLGLATAASWFAGTAAAAVPGLPAYLGDVAVLAYRGCLVNLFACTLTQQRPVRGVRVLILGGYLAVLLPGPAADLVTAALMAVLAAAGAWAARRAPADRRPALAAVAVCAAALAAVWSLAAAGAAGPGLQFGNDLALLAAAVVLVAGSIRGGWLHGAINALVVELSPSERTAAPVSALLAEALADPQLEVRYAVPGLGWFDEGGVPVNAPPADGSFDGMRVTRVDTPDGGQVALLHGAAASAGPALALAAARAAAFALDNARLGAEVRQQAAAVRESRRRLLTAGDAERRALEARLRAGPAGRLQRVDQTLAGLAEDRVACGDPWSARRRAGRPRPARPGPVSRRARRAPGRESPARDSRRHADTGEPCHQRPAGQAAGRTTGAGLLLLCRMPSQHRPPRRRNQGNRAGTPRRRSPDDERARRWPGRCDAPRFSWPARTGGPDRGRRRPADCGQPARRPDVHPRRHSAHLTRSR